MQPITDTAEFKKGSVDAVNEMTKNVPIGRLQ